MNIKNIICDGLIRLSRELLHFVATEAGSNILGILLSGYPHCGLGVRFKICLSVWQCCPGDNTGANFWPLDVWQVTVTREYWLVIDGRKCPVIKLHRLMQSVSSLYQPRALAAALRALAGANHSDLCENISWKHAQVIDLCLPQLPKAQPRYNPLQQWAARYNSLQCVTTHLVKRQSGHLPHYSTYVLNILWNVK